MSSRYRFHDSDPLVHDSAAANVAAAYNQAGGNYVAYADGDPTRLYAFDGLHAYADRHLWAVLEEKLTSLRATGTSSVRILDAGCGPGTWVRRLVTRAHTLGFTNITARGFDIARAQIQRAQMLARNLTKLPGVDLTFDVADLTATYLRPTPRRTLHFAYTVSLAICQSQACRRSPQKSRALPQGTS